MELQRSERLPAVSRSAASRALDLLARRIHGLDHGHLTLIGPHGERREIAGQGPGSEAVWHLRRPWATLVRLARHGDIGFAEGFINGEWTTPDLHALLRLAMENEHRLGRVYQRPAWQRGVDALRHWLRRNSRRGSRANIRFHYDLGNDFYRLWLDRGMGYSAALFCRGDESLERAQEHKYERLLTRLAPEPGAHILEIGCGWGGFAEFAARRGYRVTGVTLSDEQLEYARERIRQAGLADRVDLRLQDYRELNETFDHVVSIEMFEAVGERWWSTWFEQVHRCLRPGGRAAVQVITIEEAAFEYYRRNADFIQLYVFPGGMLPTPARFGDAAAAAGLQVTERAFFGADYARTLMHWYREVMRTRGPIEALGYSPAFLRMWRYYLAYCEIGFSSARVDLMQTVMERPERGLPHGQEPRG
ncbi:cyclopropane-fatty-acyl-phospholipid synthase family protein [Thioalkalivibrio sp. AKL17]|uniref:SAM-dependent methyltransferase n=1 Tax=Thioalkalivibrio sp. AKL17 TaxID=1158160 RepID=UPI000377B7F7|nr:cyclopropane-fatty-acyl-phospholipid synthase family protein [Thioalkalivibrio sp. AKL17]